MVTTVGTFHLNSLPRITNNIVSIEKTVSNNFPRQEYIRNYFPYDPGLQSTYRTYTRTLVLGSSDASGVDGYTADNMYVENNNYTSFSNGGRAIFQTVHGNTEVSPLNFGLGLFSSFPTSYDFNVEIYANEFYGINLPNLMLPPALLGSFSGTATSPGSGRMGTIIEHTISGLTLETNPNLSIFDPEDYPSHLEDLFDVNCILVRLKVTPVNFRNARHFGMGFSTFEANHSNKLDYVMPGDSITFTGSDTAIEDLVLNTPLSYGYRLDPSVTRITLTGIPNTESNAYPSATIGYVNAISNFVSMTQYDYGSSYSIFPGDVRNAYYKTGYGSIKKLIHEVVKRPLSWSGDIPDKYLSPVFAIRPSLSYSPIVPSRENSLILSFS